MGLEQSYKPIYPVHYPEIMLIDGLMSFLKTKFKLKGDLRHLKKIHRRHITKLTK